MVNGKDKEALKSMLLHHGAHDVIVALAIVCAEHAVQVRMINKQGPTSKLWEYISEKLVELSNDDAVLNTR